eukprot:1158208-Pelagomonas_calceolata.AAC.43
MEELVRKVVDLVDNRVEMNLRAIANTLLVDLPGDRSFSYDDFIASQNKYQVRSCRCCAAFMLASIQNGRSSLVTHHWRSPFVSSKVVWSCCILLSLQQAKLLGIRNEEVRRSIDDLLALVANYPRENKEVRAWQHKAACALATARKCLLRQKQGSMRFSKNKGSACFGKNKAACALARTKEVLASAKTRQHAL